MADHAVVRRLVQRGAGARPVTDAELEAQFALSEDHDVPEVLIGPVREVLGA